MSSLSKKNSHPEGFMLKKKGQKHHKRTHTFHFLFTHKKDNTGQIEFHLKHPSFKLQSTGIHLNFKQNILSQNHFPTHFRSFTFHEGNTS